MRIHRNILIASAALLAVWCAGIIAAPLLRHAGHDGAALMYGFYGRVCHQLTARSWHIAGEPLAVCVRCSAMYFSACGSLLLLLALPSRWRRMPSMAILLAAGAAVGALLPWYLVPLLLEAVDGLRQRTSARGGSAHVRQTE